MENHRLLSKAKYLRKKIKAGKAEDWKKEMFESLMNEQSIQEGVKK